MCQKIIQFLSGESGDDYFYASSGIDYIVGGNDGEVTGDTVDFSNITNKIELKLAEVGNQTKVLEGDLKTQTHTIINIENITGSLTHENTLAGNSQDNTLIGGNLNDTLSGGNGGTNYLDGGLGVNSVDYSAINTNGTGVTLNLNNTSLQEVFTNNSGITVRETLKNIQNVIGSSYKDIITGNSQSNSLFGGLGDDTLVGSAGDDILNGGDGIDVVSYASATENLYIDLGVTTPVSIGTGYGTDTFISIEGAIGGSGNDTIKGTSGSNVLIGGDGDDTLLPNGNNGMIYELDYIDGGSGTDFVSFNFGGNSTVTLDLANSGIQNTGKGRVQIVNIENVEGGAGNDSLYGNSSDNTLSGLAGDDILVS